MAFADANAPPGMKARWRTISSAATGSSSTGSPAKCVALGREFGVPTPANDTVYAVLKLHRMGKSGT